MDDAFCVSDDVRPGMAATRYDCPRTGCVLRAEFGTFYGAPGKAYDCECGAPMTEVKP